MRPDSPECTVRLYGAGDAHALVSLLTQQLKELGKATEETCLTEELKARVARLDSCNGPTVWVAATAEGTLMGYLLIHWIHEVLAREPEALISSVYVRSEQRRRGLGADLVRAAVAFAKERRSSCIWLEQNRANPAYIGQFYQQLGAQERHDLALFYF